MATAALLHQSPTISIDMAFNSISTSPTRPSPDAVAAAAAVPNPDATVNVPELRDPAYINAVLNLSPGLTESQVDAQLLAKANALGISTDAPNDKRITSSVESASTVYNARTFSMLSGASTSTALTAQSSLFSPVSPELGLASVRESKDLSFSQYDRYLSIIDPNHHTTKHPKDPPPHDHSSRSVFSGKTKKSLFSVKSGFKNRMPWRKKSKTPQPMEVIMTCALCRADIHSSTSLHNIPCGHTYCADCLRSIIDKAMGDETTMPPRCCAQPLPGYVIKEMLSRDHQQDFLKAIIQYSTPWQARVFCPNASCGEFIPPRHKVDPKHPFNVTCRKCNTRVCLMCKRNAHPTGKDCPEDWELDHAIKMEGKPGLRRCFRCQSFVEPVEDDTRMICRCSAEFCSICGGVWDDKLGCPNSCDFDDELERRRREEEALMAEYEAEKAAQEAAAARAIVERREAEERSKNRVEFQRLAELHMGEMERFLEFKARTKKILLDRNGAERQALLDRQAEQEEKMKERHGKTVSHLEDRQVAAEMDLRTTLEASERSVKIRLKHMEAYCDGLGRGTESSSSALPARVVTERDLRELGQQYNLRDGMDRLHESKINVMRDRQAKRMEELVDRQETEYENFMDENRQELDDLAVKAAGLEETFLRTFDLRKSKFLRRWELGIEILRKELEAKEGVQYAPITTPKWPEEEDAGSFKTAQETKTEGEQTAEEEVQA